MCVSLFDLATSEFDTAHAAARAYDRAAIKFCGIDADINFNVSDYDEDIKQMSNFTKEEFSTCSEQKYGVNIINWIRFSLNFGNYWGNVNPNGVRSCYDEGKRMAETLMFDYHRQHGIEIRVARIFNTYGPRMNIDDGRVVSNFIAQAIWILPVAMHGIYS
ncbi:hypothetical protein AHAS_Ahas09G0157800 [Arachis hypogaea]